MPLLHAPETAWNNCTVLFVHGIGRQPEKYSEPLYQILKKIDPALVNATRWQEVAYDSVNDAMEAKVIQFQKAIPAAAPDAGAAGLVGDFLIDLADYLVNVDPYNWINTVFR